MTEEPLLCPCGNAASIAEGAEAYCFDCYYERRRAARRCLKHKDSPRSVQVAKGVFAHVRPWCEDCAAESRKTSKALQREDEKRGRRRS